jgi:predicted permease
MAVTVALTLGLGIGATTTIFSVVEGVLLRPLPFNDPPSLVALGTTFPQREWVEDQEGRQHLAGMSVANFRDLEERARSFQALAAAEMSNLLLPDEGQGPELASLARVSDGFFTLLDVTPAVGRTFLPEEHETGSGQVFLITHSAWERRFGADPSVVGRDLNTTGTPAKIIGILPQNFKPPEVFFSTIPDFWAPLQDDHARYSDRGRRSLLLLGRLAPGVTVESARSEGRRIAAELAAEFPEGNVYPDGSWFGIGVNGLLAETVGDSGRGLMIFFAASGLVLLLATLNAATLFLARSLDRVRELGIRVALGAGRNRVVRLLLSEAAVLTLLGSVVGIAIAVVGLRAFKAFAPGSMPRTDMVEMNGLVLTVAVVLSVGAGLAAGLVPALRLSHREPWARLNSGGRTLEPGSRLRTILAGGQVALAVVLLSGAGLLFNSFLHLRYVDPGFEPDGLITLRVDLKRPDAPPGEMTWDAWEGVLAEVGSVPGLDGVAGTTNPPFQSPFWAPRLLLPGDPEDAWRDGVAGYAITPGYFDLMRTNLIQGRDFTPRDGPNDEAVVIVNEAFVRTHLADSEPVGTILRHAPSEGVELPVRIVGVVEDVVQTRAQDGMRPAAYFPYTQVEWPLIQVALRTALPTEAIVPSLRQAVARFNSVVPPVDVRTMAARMASTRQNPRFQTLLIGAFALVAVLLAGMGLYGIQSHGVRRRRREFGVRMALGSARSGLLRMVLAQGMTTAAAGLALGVLVALITSRVLEGFLYEVEPNDVGTLVAVGAVLLGVSALASFFPARKATRVDPVDVLNSD